MHIILGAIHLLQFPHIFITNTRVETSRCDLRYMFDMKQKQAWVCTQSSCLLVVVILTTLLDSYDAFSSYSKRRVRHGSSLHASSSEVREMSKVGSLQLDAQELDQALRRCKTSRQAKIVLQSALGKSESDRNNVVSPSLFGSISPPVYASTKTISDGDLAIQTRTTNKKYTIMELIELSGDRDADRASLSLLCLTIASTVSALVANQNLAGPEIIRFLIVWILSFAPLFFVGFGISMPSELLSILVAIQREVFPAFRQRTIQHEAGHFLMGHLLGFPVEKYRANAVKNAVAFYPLKDAELAQDRARMLGFDASKAPKPNDSESAPVSSRGSAFFGPEVEEKKQQSVSLFFAPPRMQLITHFRNSLLSMSLRTLGRTEALMMLRWFNLL